jgi:peroxiredoxin
LDSAACSPKASYGTTQGELIQNFALMDQHGRKIYLEDFCGDVVVLQMGAMWCPSCQAEANKIPMLMDKYGSQGLAILNLLAETPTSEPPTQADLLAWSDYFDVSSPVLADPNWQIWERYFELHVTPRAILINREGRIQKIDYVISEEDIQSALDNEEWTGDDGTESPE